MLIQEPVHVCMHGPAFDGQTAMIDTRQDAEIVSASGIGAPFFENHSHQRSVRDHLISGRLPLKFAYAGSAALTHAVLAGSQGYQAVIGAAEFEAAALRALFRLRPPPRQIAEVGPGNGVHTVSLLNALGNLGMPCERYLAVDFSRTLLDMAVRRIRRGADPRTAVAAAHWDIESGPSSVLHLGRAPGRPLLLCLLGNTIGNVEDPVGALHNLADSMQSGDVLLLGLTLRSGRSDDELLAPYRSDAFRAAALEPLRCAGVDPADIDFLLDWENDAVIGKAVLRRHSRIGDVDLPAGHRVRCFSSRRFRPDMVTDLLPPPRWRILRVSVHPGGEHLVVAAAPRGGGGR